MPRIDRTIWLLLVMAWLSTALARADESATPAVASDDAFRTQVQPLFNKYCGKCHAGSEPKGEFAFEGLLKRATLAADRQAWEKVVVRLHDKEMPPEDEPQPSDEERKTMTAWIDAGLANNDCGGSRDPGRVTLRRLNRNEYNNTIRDLLGVDFHPADDFPSDDVGYGFDNIGDVLSMPPILLEKYLAAAQIITQRALGTDQANLVTGEVTGGLALDGGARVLSSAGEVRTRVRMTGQGDYLIRVRAYGDQAGDEPVKMGVHFDNQTIRTVEVKAVEAQDQVYEVWHKSKGGEHVVSVTFDNDYYDADRPAPNDRNLYVRSIELMGPYPPTYAQLIVGERAVDDKRAAAREILGPFMKRAFRRPVTPDEIDRVMRVFELADREGESLGGSVAVAIQAILVSPHFLFRVELDPEDPQAVRALDDHELATRLSYFLWSSMPDDELVALADAGTLRQADHLPEQVKRMLADPKSRALVDNFAGQWLQLRNLKTISPDREVYPLFDESLREAMREETELFFANVVAEDRSVLDFLDGDYTFVNDRLARHYGIQGIKGKAFQRVTLDPEQRGGVLTHASVLTVTSNPTRTSPVKRGKWVLENLLGTPPPPPPAAVPPLAEDQVASAAASLRERMQQHRAKAECGVCHNRMDPLGFGLENYDGIGTWRTIDGTFDIDPSGTLPGGVSFSGPRQLKDVLRARQDDFLRCLAEKMLTYGLGRGVEYSDRCTVTEIVGRLKSGEFKFSSLILGVVESEPFQKRRGRGDRP